MMRSSPFHDAPPDDRLLVVIGVVTGACVALARLASATGVEGTSWLMVLIQVTVAAQGGAALLWVVRAGLRWAVGRATGSHAILDAYRHHDTATYVVFLLSLATALGVQLVPAVVWLPFAMFAAAQWWVVRRAVRARVTARAERVALGAASVGDVAVMAFVGAAIMLYAISWMRLVENEWGATAGVATLFAAAVLGGVGFGLLLGMSLAAKLDARWRAVAIALLVASGAWGFASARLLPDLVATSVGAAPLVAGAAVVLSTALPMVAMAAALSLQLAQGPAAREPSRSQLTLMCAAALGAAGAGMVAADLLFAFTGLRGGVWSAAGCNLVAALAMIPRPSAPRETM